MDAAQRARFWNDGFLVGTVGLSDSDVDDALREVSQLTYAPIFLEVYREERDQYRLQARVTEFGPGMKAIHKHLAELASDTEPYWEVHRASWNALKSLPGGSHQAIHRDYPTFETAEAILTKDCVQASVIVALMNKTYFYVYPGCFGGHVDRGKVVRLELKRGEVLIFRGDLVHCGADFKKENIRLHCYVRVQSIPQQPDSTEAAVFNTYLCEHCATTACDSKRHLSNHGRHCKLNKDKSRRKKLRKKADDKGGYCEACKLDFPKRSAYHQHNHRSHPKRKRQRQNSEEESEQSESEDENEESESEEESASSD